MAFQFARNCVRTEMPIPHICALPIRASHIWAPFRHEIGGALGVLPGTYTPGMMTPRARAPSLACMRAPA